MYRLATSRSAFTQRTKVPADGFWPWLVSHSRNGAAGPEVMDALPDRLRASDDSANCPELGKTRRRLLRRLPASDLPVARNVFAGRVIDGGDDAFASFEVEGGAFVALDMHYSTMITRYAEAMVRWGIVMDAARARPDGFSGEQVTDFWAAFNAEEDRDVLPRGRPHPDDPSRVRLSSRQQTIVEEIASCAEEFVLAHEMAHVLYRAKRDDGLVDIAADAMRTFSALMPDFNGQQFEEITCDVAAACVTLADRSSSRTREGFDLHVVFGSVVALVALGHYYGSWIVSPATEDGPPLDETHPGGLRRVFIYLDVAAALLRERLSHPSPAFPTDFDPFIGLGIAAGFAASACGNGESLRHGAPEVDAAAQENLMLQSASFMMHARDGFDFQMTIDEIEKYYREIPSRMRG